jgi:hypothetical protein
LVFPEQTDMLPFMLPGADGAAVTVTGKICANEEPHALFAVTAILPPVEPAVALMVAVTEVPVQPEGNIQLYDVAPGTGAML